MAGQIRQHPGYQLASALTGLWFRYRVERRSGDDKWEVIDRGTRTDTFLLSAVSDCAAVLAA